MTAEEQILQVRAEALGYRLHQRGTEYYLFDKDGLRAGAPDLDGIAILLDYRESRRSCRCWWRIGVKR
jgi:hypothetical protein